jgi:uncharacterized lipoprotein (TIGR02269 family)
MTWRQGLRTTVTVLRDAMTATLRQLLLLLGMLLSACASPTLALSDGEQSPHGEHADCGEHDGCVTLVCAEELCGLYRCEDAGVLLARGGGVIAPPAAPGAGPRRNWGRAQELPGGNGPVFVIRWNNHPPPPPPPGLMPSGSGWVKHHLFPQARSLADWFAAAPRGIQVHDFTMVIPRGVHRRIHNPGGRGGPWNQEWHDFRIANPTATQQQVWLHLGELIKKYHLLGPIVPYYQVR